MKRFLLYLTCIVGIIFLAGCSMDNTPTKKVESYLNSFKNMNEEVMTQMDDVMSQDKNMTEKQKESYKEALKRQYQDLTYTIKDETIDGDIATVTAEIEVYDYYKANNESNKYYEEHQDEFSNIVGGLVGDIAEEIDDMIDEAAEELTDNNEDNKQSFIDYRIKSLTETKERVTYTIDFTLTKVDNEWLLDDADDATIQKIHGLYAY